MVPAPLQKKRPHLSPGARAGPRGLSHTVKMLHKELNSSCMHFTLKALSKRGFCCEIFSEQRSSLESRSVRADQSEHLTFICAVHDGHAVICGQEGRLQEQRPHLDTKRTIFELHKVKQFYFCLPSISDLCLNII